MYVIFSVRSDFAYAHKHAEFALVMIDKWQFLPIHETILLSFSKLHSFN